jgi:diguanylate cyclase (GGDEF)-like protein
MNAQNIRHGQPMIGVLAGWSTLEGTAPDYYRAAVIRGIQSAARIRKCHLMLSWGMARITETADHIYPAWPAVSPETDFVPVGPWNTDGLIIFTPLRNESRSSYIQELISAGHPVIFVAAGEKGPTIAVDNEKGIRQAVAHLVYHGHRNIAFIAGAPLDKGDSEARLQGYYSAMTEYKLDVDCKRIAQGWHTVSGGYKAMQEILDSGSTFTAVVASNDNSAIGAMQAIREAGLHIPRDVAIIGFDDQPAAVTQVPTLSTVHVPLTMIGEQALVMMADHLAGKTPIESILISTRLIQRSSCGCMPQAVSSLFSGTPRIAVASQSRFNPSTESLSKKKEQLVNNILGVLPSELRYPGEERFRLICNSLVNEFFKSLEELNPIHFQTFLLEFLDQLETIGTIGPWQEMISILRQRMKQIPVNWKRVGTCRLAEDLLHQVRVVISVSAERNDQRHQYQRGIAAQALNELVSRLSATLDERRAIELLDTYLLGVGIRHARVVLFEPEAGDPVAWSGVLNANIGTTNLRFPSRQFPPQELYPFDELLNILLLPLVFQDEAFGYMAFDASNLEPCAVLARQMAATIKASRLHAQVIELSLTDALTGLHNRRYFDLFLKNEVSRQQRFAHGLAIILMDVDNFKEYNDTYGHPAGDDALQELAKCLSQGRRNSDMAGRIGGDEFVMILPETDVNGALKVIRKIRASIAGLSDLKRPISVSFGLTVPQGIGFDAETLVKQADIALYKAKRTGRNHIIVFENMEVAIE